MFVPLEESKAQAKEEKPAKVKEEAPKPSISEESLQKWQSKVPRLKQRLSILLKCAKFPHLTAPADQELTFPIQLRTSDDQVRTEFTYEETKQVEVLILQKVAPLIEGSTESRSELLHLLTRQVNEMEMPQELLDCLKEPEELLNSCFSRQDTLSGQHWEAFCSLGNVQNKDRLPQHTWKANFLEMLGAGHQSSEVKKLRQKRRLYLTKVELFVSLIHALDRDDVDASLSEQTLEKWMQQLNKIENDEYLAAMKAQGALKRNPPAVKENKREPRLKL